MKRIKPGFTLAEVLITLGIIGVVAAIVMPSIMTNYTYKTVGVKLSKFASQLEAATRPYVVQNTSFTGTDADITEFVTESFIIKNLDDVTFTEHTCTTNDEEPACEGKNSGDKVKVASPLTSTATRDDFGPLGTPNDTDNRVISLKDGTSLIVYPIANYDDDDMINNDQVGEVVWGVSFAPEVNGLPRAINKTYKFAITELGYVYPDMQDTCLRSIYEADFQTTTKSFTEDRGCKSGEAKKDDGGAGAGAGAGS